MPKFGGFGTNGSAAQTDDEAEKQAAKKAERAVAAAWGAGKNVWSKSQQQTQHDQQASHQDASKDEASAAISSGDATKNSSSADGASVQAGSPPASVKVNGIHSTSGEDGIAAATGKEKASAAKSGSQNANSDAVPSKKQTQSKPPAGKNAKGAGTQQHKAAATTVPSFEDVNNWPSPLDAGKKTGEKPRASVGSSDHDAQTQPGTQKSLKETLDELQVRLAPGANPQQAGATAGGAKKGKQQWVPILPEITHASHNAPGAKGARPAQDAKQGKGTNKQQQQRKEGNKGAGQSQQSGQSAKKDAANKAKDKSSQAKDGVNQASTGVKASETRGKKESPAQPTSQDQKVGAAVPSEANAGPEMSSAATVVTESKVATSQGQSAHPKQSSSSATESASAGTEEKQTTSTPASASARDASATKQSQQARTHLRPLPNGISRPNGVVPSRSGASSGTGTPITNRGSPRGSFVSSPNVHPNHTAPSHTDIVQPPPIFYGPSGAATPMHANSSTTWLPYTTPFSRPIPYLFDTTQQTGAPLPPAPLGPLLTQIEFYFSQHNLQGDFFLRGKMDAQGWVDMGVLAGFKRVQAMTEDVQTVKDALLYSAVLDVDGWRVRRRFGWEMYVLPAAEMVESEVNGRPNGDKAEKDGEKVEGEDEEEALGVVAASGFGGALEA
uniref:HTH La-type RNA-binding domain-containing protein n=2 Tax=Kalmanozyma brasiliensis (strain GHG001) TaxID=1365824 RepID=V5E7T4_KALBG